MRIEYLADNKELVPILAQYNYEQWGKTAWKNVDEVINAYSETANKDKIPLTVVALDDDNRLLGFASLIKNDMETRQDLSPWLAALYVLKEHRKKGVGSALIKRIIVEATSLKIPRVYLFTDDHRANYYSKQGWKLIEKVDYKGFDSVIMEYVLGALAKT